MIRRSFLSLTAAFALAARRANAEEYSDPDWAVHDLRLEGDPALARRALLLLPKHATPAKPRLLILLHGLGETRSELAGIHAWPKLYGLVQSYARLRRPPIERTSPKLRYLTDARLVELDRELGARPFEGFAVACPVTPNPGKQPAPERAMDRFARWIEESLLSAVQQRWQPTAKIAVGIDGCSMGGPVAFEVFLRRPELFGTVGGVQSAFNIGSAARYAERIAAALGKVGPKPIHLETSTADPFRKANERLARELTARKISNELRVVPGPHDQPWLREAGTLEMLLFHDRHLGESA